MLQRTSWFYFCILTSNFCTHTEPGKTESK
jgi:hypothetical protein